MIIDPKPHQNTHFLYTYVPLRIHHGFAQGKPNIKEYCRIRTLVLRGVKLQKSVSLSKVQG